MTVKVRHGLSCNVTIPVCSKYTVECVSAGALAFSMIFDVFQKHLSNTKLLSVELEPLCKCCLSPVSNDTTHEHTVVTNVLVLNPPKSALCLLFQSVVTVNQHSGSGHIIL